MNGEPLLQSSNHVVCGLSANGVHQRIPTHSVHADQVVPSHHDKIVETDVLPRLE